MEQGVIYADSVIAREDIKEKNLGISIELGLDGYSFSVKDIDDKRYIFYGSREIKYESTYTRMLSALIESIETREDINRLVFKEANVIYSDAIYSVMPSALYDEGHRRDYLSFTVGRDLTQDKNIVSERVDTHDAVCVFQVQDKITQYISSRAEEVKNHHSVVGLMNMIPVKVEEGHVIYVYMYNTHMCVAVVSTRGLELINTYKVKEAATFAYYMLAVCNVMGVNERSVPIVLYGAPSRYAAYADVIKRYFAAARFARRNVACEYSSALDMVAEYEAPNVFNF